MHDPIVRRTVRSHKFIHCKINYPLSDLLSSSPSAKTNARRSPLRLTTNKRGCSPPDKTQFITNLVKMFNNEYSRHAKHIAGASEKRVLEWKFTSLDKNSNHVLDKNEFRELKRLVKGVVKPKRCSRAFGRFCDLDSDERLTKQEWTSCFNRESSTGNQQNRE